MGPKFGHFGVEWRLIASRLVDILGLKACSVMAYWAQLLCIYTKEMGFEANEKYKAK
jgi:hypothetical protein